MSQAEEKAVDQPQSARSKLLESSLVVSAMTMLSRIAGLARDVIIARMFGATASADAFFIAFRIPQFLRRLFAEGAFAQAFVPVLNEYKNKRATEGELASVKSLVNAVAGVLSGTLTLITIVVVLAAPLIAYIFAPGFTSDEEKFSQVVYMLRITFPYLMLISLTGMASGILNSYGRFWVPAFTPVLLNLCLIAAALWLSPHLSEPVFALAWAVLIAGFAQLIFQLPFLARIDLLPTPTWDRQHPGVRKIMTLMLPAIFGVSVSQINLLLDTVLASFLPTGSVTWLYFSDRLVELPLGIFGIAIATVLLPTLSAIRFANPDDDAVENQRDSADTTDDGFKPALVRQFLATLDWSLRLIVFLGLPACVALVMMAEPLLFLLFQYDVWQPDDVFMAALSLRAYAFGLLWFMAIKVLAVAYFSRQDTRTPVRIGIIAMVANMLLNLLFVFIAHTYWQVGHVGLALATAVSAFINAALLYRGLSRDQQLVSNSQRKGSLLQSGSPVLIVKILLATVVMSAVLWFLLPESVWWVDASFTARLAEVAVLVATGLFCYLLSAVIFGVRIADFRLQEDNAVNASSENAGG